MKGTRLAAVLLGLLAASPLLAQRTMERLDRGVVATRADGKTAFVSWRLFATDAANLGFDVYRSTAGAAGVKLNAAPLVQGTNFRDTTADLAKENRYWVRTATGVNSGAWTLKANAAWEPAYVIPLRAGPQIHFAWVGDLDGDGEYDFVVDRLDYTNGNCKIEAYRRDGKFLWQLDYGPNSRNMDNISPGSATIGTGQWDGVTVYDLDMDGKAEVITKIADSVVFGDGARWTNASDSKQWVAVLDGMTGALRSYVAVPTDYLSTGPLALQLGIGYLDGKSPSIIGRFKNRNADKSFNDMICAFQYSNGTTKLQWKWLRNGADCPAFHQIRIVDVDGDGKDDVADGGYVIDESGKLLYSLGPQGVVHGDRFHIGKLDPSRAGLQGYGIQQDNASGLKEYYYDAGTGKILWKHSGEVSDMARGMAADVDSTQAGYEVWTFNGLYNAAKDALVSDAYPYPSIRFWWDGDDLSELYNDGKIEKWNSTNKAVDRMVTTWKFHGATGSDRGAPQFMGDIVGDWREEAILATPNYDSLVIFTTQAPTSRRLYTLSQNPAYRNCMTVKGYYQSNMLDYYLGHGMSAPVKPDIVLAGKEPAVGMAWSGTLSSSASWKVERLGRDGIRIQAQAGWLAWDAVDLSGRVLESGRTESGVVEVRASWQGMGIFRVRSAAGSGSYPLIGL